MASKVISILAATATVASAAPQPSACANCCNTQSLFMCNELGGIGGAHGAVCCANGQWGCPKAGAARASGCPDGVGYKMDCPVPSPNTKSFMIAKFTGPYEYPHDVLLGSGDSERVRTDGDKYTPFIWKAGKIASAYDQGRCLSYDDYTKNLVQVACSRGTVWETYEVTPKADWTRQGREPVVNWVTGKGAKKMCVQLVGTTPKLAACNGGDAQKWFLWNPTK